MSQFEKVIKSVMENYETPLQNGAWNEFDQKLNPNKKSSFFNQFVVAGVVLTASLVVLNDKHDGNGLATHHNDLSHGYEMVAQNQEVETNSNESYIVTDLNTENSESQIIESISNAHLDQGEEKNSSSSKSEVKDNLSLKEKETLIDINETIKEKVDKTPVTEYVGKDFNLNANMLLTPNGDGLHDYFLPEAISEGDDFLMKIFDARNNMIFSTSEVENPWTGFNQNTGSMTVPGKYRWKVILATENRKEIFNGFIKVE